MQIGDTLLITSAVAGVGIIATCWGYIKQGFGYVSSLLVVSITIDSDTSWVCQYAVTAYLMRNMTKSPFGTRRYSGLDIFVRPRNRMQFVGYENLSNFGVFWKGWRPMWTSFNKGKDDNRTSLNLFFIRGTFSFDKIYSEAINCYNEIMLNRKVRKEKRFRVKYVFGSFLKSENDGKNPPSSRSNDYSEYVHIEMGTFRLLDWKLTDVGSKQSPLTHPMDIMVLTEELKKAVEEVKFWYKSEEWYIQRSIPWKRGWLLYGKPGTGKTSLARAVAQEMDLPVYVFDLPSLTNEELRLEWNKMLCNVPCMALIEDIDSTFDGRTNVSMTGKLGNSLTFDSLLNTIDGIERSDGLMLVITTNHIEKVDPAIGVCHNGHSSRPGRVDRVIEMTPPDREGFLVVAKRIIDDAALCEKLADEGVVNNETIAQFQERCAQIALGYHWEDFKGSRTPVLSQV